MLSVVMATYNEEKMIEESLKSVKEIADEIIVVDGTSSDRTVELAKKHGARVIKTTNKPNFHINKQMAIDAAKGDLILQLDADEVLDTSLLQFIKDIHASINDKSLRANQPVAWWLKRKNYFLGTFLKKGGQYPDPVIRLFLKQKAYLPQKDVHEQMVVEGELGWAKGHLLHYGNPSFTDYVRKFNTYTSFKATQLQDMGLKINFLNSINYIICKPFITFCSLYIRHKGFVDKIPGFVFALMSGLHHTIAYLKLWEMYQQK